MNTNRSDGGDSVFCRAAMNYLTADSRDPQDTVAAEVTIRDGRTAKLPGWEVCGFELKRHAAAVKDWNDRNEVAEVHYPEMAELARALTGCDHALVSGHISRNPEEAARHQDLAPISFVHSDFAASYGDLVRNAYRQPTEDAARALAREGISGETVIGARRLLILQFWRNTGPPRMDLPIAFCDARSVPAAALRTFPVQNYADTGIDFETLGVVAPQHPDEHRWYTFPEMRTDEVVAFRTYDSERVTQGEPFWTPHSAFADPRVAPGQPSRRSIELRAVCLFL
ncbi:MAG: CmcJ/NvfI family oxidoreductase [Pseudomonadota bacterium]